MKVIAVTNQKGGVGKTTITFNLCKELARNGYKTLAVDNDPQGNLSSAFLEEPTELPECAHVIQIYRGKEKAQPLQIEENLSLLGSNILLSRVSDEGFDVIFQLKEGLEEIAEHFDFIVIDCLPSFGHLHLSALNVADYILIPTELSQYGLMALKDLFEVTAKTKKRLNPNLQILGVIINLVDGKKLVIEKELEEVLRENYGELLFDSKITRGVKFKESVALCQSIHEYAPKSKQNQQFNDFFKEFLKRLKL